MEGLIVGVSSKERHRDVGMCVDEAGDHQSTLGVDRSVNIRGRPRFDDVLDGPDIDIDDDIASDDAVVRTDHVAAEDAQRLHIRRATKARPI